MMSFYNSFEEIFQEMKKRLTLTPTAMKLWIEPLKPLKLNNNHVLLYVESQFSKDMTMANFKTVMEEAFSDLLGFDVEVEILCSEDLTVEQKLKYGIESYADSSPKELQKELDDDDIVKTRLKNSELASNYQHTFDTFIVGDNNKLAYAACKAVVQEPSTRYNPLYIYSEPGLGKTHLLSAVKSEMEKLHPDMNIIYTTADTFTDDYVSNLRTKSNLEAFKQKYRSCDLLLIDDIQFMANKSETQQELFHTFNSLYNQNKQIIFTSDRPPKELNGIEQRLISRFEQGLLADIAPPEYETRIAIIKRKAELYGMNLPDSIVIGLYEEDGNILNCVLRDTLMNGQFSFRDTVSTTRKMLIMSDNRGFPGTWLEVWIAPGEYIEIKGQDKLVKTWEVVSDVPEQQEENRFMACAMAQQKELMQYMAAEYDWQRMMFIDHPGDREFESQAWAKIDSIRKLSMPLQQEIWKKEMEYMEEAPVSPVWMDRLLFFASMMKYETIMPYKEEVKKLYARMSEADKQTGDGQEITAYVYPPATVGVGDMMVDGDLYDANDSLRHISEFKGKFILLDFWSSGCGPCVESIPEMEKVMDLYKDKMTVISISEDPKARWKEYIKTKGMGGNQWNELRKGRTGLALNYQVRGIPHYVLIAPDGKIQDVWSGYGAGSLLGQVEKNLK